MDRFGGIGHALLVAYSFEKIALLRRAEDHDGSVEVTAKPGEFLQILTGTPANRFVGRGEVESFGLGEEPMEADAFEPGILDLLFHGVPLFGADFSRAGGKGKGGYLDAGVADFTGIPEGLFERPVLEGFVADRVFHGRASRRRVELTTFPRGPSPAKGLGIFLEERGVVVVEIIQLPSLDFLVHVVLNGGGIFELVGGQDRESITFLLRPSGTTDTVHVVLRILGDTIVDDMGDAGHIKSTSGNVGRDNDVEGAVAESLQRFGAVTLTNVGVEGGRLGALDFLDANEERVGLFFRSGENHHAVEAGAFHEFEDEFVALVHPDGVESVAHGFGRGAAFPDLDFGRLFECPVCESLDRARHGCREEKGLASGRAAVDDFLHVGKESHVEHAIDFIEDEILDIAEIEIPFLDVIEETAGGGDNDIGLALERFDLVSVADAAVQKHDVERLVVGEDVHLILNLSGKFAGWFKDQALRLGGSSHRADNRKCEGGCLSGSCLGCPDDVTSLEGNRNGLSLNGGWFLVTCSFYGTEDGS